MITNTILLLKKLTVTSSSQIYPYYIHGWVYYTIRQTIIGQHYHQAQVAPFTLKDFNLDEEGNLFIYLIFLDYQIMLQFIRNLHNGMEIRLGNDFYTLMKTAIHPNQHQHAGMVRYESFYRLPIANRVRMDFKHTAFSSQHKTDVLPSPQKVVRSLLFKWNETSPYAIDVTENHFQQLASGMLITSHSIQTSQYHIRSDLTLTTFSGRVVYANMHQDEKWKQLLNTLMHFAQYSGVGWKCSYGMGRVDVTPVLKGVLAH